MLENLQIKIVSFMSYKISIPIEEIYLQIYTMCKNANMLQIFRYLCRPLY